MQLIYDGMNYVGIVWEVAKICHNFIEVNIYGTQYYANRCFSDDEFFVATSLLKGYFYELLLNHVSYKSKNCIYKVAFD